jgi:type I restriction-modification system DNA methylase subunit
MPAVTDQREAIAAALSDFGSYSLADAACRLFAVLGYKSDRHIPVATTRAFCESFDPKGTLTQRERDQLGQLTSLHFLFQLTDTELTSQRDLLSDSGVVENTRIHSYLFFAAELPAGAYTRTFLSGIARAINKPLPMPALVLIRHGDAVSVAILHRRLNKREADKDVLEKATLIKDVRCGGKDEPIRAHLEILNDFVLANLDAEFGIHNFVSLHNAWQKRLATFALNDRFYDEVANWYFWAKKLIASGEIVPPRDVDTDPERSLFLIRLLTRLIFCWFLLEKRLLPPSLFREKDLHKLLADLDPASPTFYRAVLQNLFFGTLNQPADERGFRKRSASGGRDPNRGITNLWRYADAFRDPARWEEVAKTIPFLNGGLFDCLDRIYEKAEAAENSRLDGFSDNPKEAATLPNYLFFDDTGRTENLSSEFGEEEKANARSRKTPVGGLIQILSRYKFTVEENTPLDEEIALDPELLGKVFENLLASYNPETRDTARKALGAFYTPREVVSFMVDEALLAYLTPALATEAAEKKNPSVTVEEKLRALFAADSEHFDNPFTATETARLVAALDDVKILDPACGSGAFPMGALQRLVNLLAKLDPENEHWEARQRARVADDKAAAAKTADLKERAEKLAELQRWEDELNAIFDTDRFHPDYARKVFLIENAIFGADIQPIAVQIAKLRFFIALICDQKTEASTTPLPLLDNFGVLPLPNLETRIVAANTLLPVGSSATGRLGQADLLDQRVDKVRAELRQVHHDHFQARTLASKRRCRERDATLRADLARILRESGLPADRADALATTNLFDQNSSSPFFEPAWMFSHPSPRGGHSALEGFDLVLGNPPYVRQEKIKDQKDDLKPHYTEIFTGTADLYVYFYARALQLLRPGGILSYITSNKWYRAAYGEKLRAHLGKTTTLLHAIDFGDAPVFTAIAYPTIIITRKAAPPPKHTFRALNWDPETPTTEIANFAKFYDSKVSRIAQGSLSEKGWRFLAKKNEDLLAKIRTAGVSLGEFVKGRFYWGIKTGFNEAFVVDQMTRDRLIAEHKSSTELLKPLLRGRDVKRWFLDYGDLWLIFTRRGTDIEKYPAIKAHLSKYRTQLEPKPANWPSGKPWEGRKPGPYKWFEIQDNIAYWKELAETKVITPAITGQPNFCPDSSGFYPNNKCSVFVTERPFYVAALANSSVGFYFAKRVYATKDAGFIDFEPRYSSQFPIPMPDEESKIRTVESLAGIVSFLHNQPETPSTHPRDPLMRDYYEELLNALVYELYLPEELHAAGLRMFDRVAAADLPALATTTARDQKPDASQLIALRAKFEELHTPSHPLRAALQKLHTLDPIRIIEGKA